MSLVNFTVFKINQLIKVLNSINNGVNYKKFSL